MEKIEYSILCHYPSIVMRDCITLGILFYNIDSNKCVMESTEKWDRVKAFNDELDIKFVKLQISDIEKEVNECIKNDLFNLSDYTRFYVNELKFTEVAKVEVEDFDKFVYECKRNFLRFDFDIKDRPNSKEQVSFIKNTLKQSEIEYENGKVYGYFNESIKFDFVIKNYAFKIFRFEGKKESRLLSSVKDWAYDAYKLKDRYKIVFVTDIDFSTCKEYKILFKILKEECKEVISFSELMPFINNISEIDSIQIK